MGYRGDYTTSIHSLLGDVLAYVDIDEVNNQILLTTKNGRTVRVYHHQECCETVRIRDTEGDWHDLIGKVIVETSYSQSKDVDPPSGDPESWTLTELKFRVDDSTVINRWIGESNGAYSESVDFEDVPKWRN